MLLPRRFIPGVRSVPLSGLGWSGRSRRLLFDVRRAVARAILHDLLFPAVAFSPGASCEFFIASAGHLRFMQRSLTSLLGLLTARSHRSFSVRNLLRL